MKKILLSSVAALACASIAQVTNAADSPTTITTSVKKKVEVIEVSCYQPHFAFFRDKNGKQHCMQFKNPPVSNH